MDQRADPDSGTRGPRDSLGHGNHANVIYGSSADLYEPPPPSKCLEVSRASKRKGTADSDDCPSLSISVSRYNTRGYWITSKPTKRGRLLNAQDQPMDLHQSTCLNLTTDGTESDLWILPDMDTWELDAESPTQRPSPKKEGQWGPLLQRAVSSNRERLRRRLEGDGWDFVGGKYGEDTKMYHEMKESQILGEERVDEEFDVVVLPILPVSC